MAERKGASSLAKMDPAILIQLEAGTIETATLTEGLAINMGRLLAAVAPDIDCNQLDLNAGIVQRMAQAGAILRNHGDPRRFKTHPSDTVRGWVAFAIGQNAEIASLDRLDAIRDFAADKHFGVREWAWMAVRAIIVAEPMVAIEHLTPWTTDADPNVRRFASEATRPRGVWAGSVPLLRKEPWHGLAVLAPLRFDAERYVEDSVANWLNDAAKDSPDWTRTILKEWQCEGVSNRLIKRAARSLPQP
jgi:3-methyladenine DNA glycosylase AlkC